jgi:hypothetical protein
MYLGVATASVRNYQRGATILKVNITEFSDMGKNGEIYRILTDREPISIKFWIVVPKSLQQLAVSDAELLGVSYYSITSPWLAVLVQSQYIVFCNYNALAVIYYTADNLDLTCYNGTTI